MYSPPILPGMRVFRHQPDHTQRDTQVTHGASGVDFHDELRVIANRPIRTSNGVANVNDVAELTNELNAKDPCHAWLYIGDV